jgi:hypothetical protein
MQRALISLLRGDLAASFAQHPALLPLLATLVFSGVQLYFNFRNGARLIVIFFVLTVSLMIVNFVVKSLLHL